MTHLKVLNTQEHIDILYVLNFNIQGTGCDLGNKKKMIISTTYDHIQEPNTL
jgi:hypothetical protein